jgi:hypothetical protein
MTIPPTLEEVQHYMLQRRNGLDPNAFLDYYQSVGWMIGKKKMKDWQAAVRTWERNRKPTKQDDIMSRLNDKSWAN